MKFVPEVLEEPAYEKITLGGGCFWCIDSAFRHIKGVVEVSSGYSGGTMRFPSYAQVSRGESGHVEVVELTFAPDRISLETILYIFFTLHDPTTPDRQGNDVGPQYASTIFYRTKQQKETAIAVIEELQKKEVFDAPIITKIIPFTTFWIAEDYHQNYVSKSPNNPYCSLVIQPKLSKLRKQWSHLIEE